MVAKKSWGEGGKNIKMKQNIFIFYVYGIKKYKRCATRGGRMDWGTRGRINIPASNRHSLNDSYIRSVSFLYFLIFCCREKTDFTKDTHPATPNSIPDYTPWDYAEESYPSRRQRRIEYFPYLKISTLLLVPSFFSFFRCLIMSCSALHHI